MNFALIPGVLDDCVYISGVEVTEEPAPAPKPAPQIPPPCWDSRPIDAQKCMDAVHAMCGG